MWYPLPPLPTTKHISGLRVAEDTVEAREHVLVQFTTKAHVNKHFNIVKIWTKQECKM